jgi:ArsR family transcriptional regulator, arsenate/arsenite/antimonite-responsive transcriptional repressor / arsenate reductase (thioredoxin)
MRVLFLCTANSARSQMAEALLRDMSKGTIEVFSAGSRPAAQIHPMARATIQKMLGHDLGDQQPKSFDAFVGQPLDYVITVCDRAAEECPVFPGDPERIHWSFEDPAAVDGAEAQAHAFHKVATEIAARLRIWLSLPALREQVDRAAAR